MILHADLCYIIGEISHVAKKHPTASKDLAGVIDLIRGIENGTITPDYYAVMEAEGIYGE